MSRRLNFKDERGDLVLSHIIWLVVIFAIVVFLVVELGPLLWTRFSIMQEAQDVGDGVSLNYRMNRNQQAAVVRGGEIMSNMGYSDKEITDSRILFVPQADPTDIQVTTVRYYNNLITKISWFKKFGKISTTKTVNIAGAKAKS